MEIQIQTEKLEKLVAVFDGEIKEVKSYNEVHITYFVLPNKDSLVNPKGVWPQAALINKGVKPNEGDPVKIGIYTSKKGLPSVRVLNETESFSFREPQTEIEKFEQKVWIYRALTHSSYYPAL